MRKIGQESDGIKSNTYYDNDKDGVLVKTSTDIAPVIFTIKEFLGLEKIEYKKRPSISSPKDPAKYL